MSQIYSKCQNMFTFFFLFRVLLAQYCLRHNTAVSICQKIKIKPIFFHTPNMNVQYAKKKNCNICVIHIYYYYYFVCN